MHLHPEAVFIIQALLLIGVPFFVWKIRSVRRFMPLVVVQILLGVTLGPSVLGKVSPELYHALFPVESLPILSGLAWMALILFGFLTGLHLDIKEISGKGARFLGISLSTVLVPAVLGGTAALFFLDPIFLGAKATPTIFVLGMAIAVGVTALPVLAAILLELGIIHHRLGKKVLGYATVNDIFLWVLVSILIAMANSSGIGAGGTGTVIMTIVLTIIYTAIMYTVIRPFLEWMGRKNILTNEINHTQLVLIFSMMFVSALATEFIGIHYLLGAFIFGAMVPKSITQELHHSLEKFVGVTLLPFFFMLTGLKTAFDAGSPSVWILFGVMTVIASFGKILGTAVPEIFSGATRYEALQAGSLMQTKGLMEVVVLNLMLAGGIISPVTFSAMLFMAVVTTALTKPSLLALDAIFKRTMRVLHDTKSQSALDQQTRVP